jgi:pimeloyl-ACP methyl ester carboxylesterase
MRVDLVSAVPGLAAKLCIVLIPGAYQGPEDFRSAGFLAAVHERNLNIDLALVAPQLAHLTDRTVLARLRNEVVLPARSSGRVGVWFAGVSWGGFLALLYAADHSTDLEGICLLAPYLGNRMINTEILGFPSLANWSAGVSGAQDELNEERRVWRYIIAHAPHSPPEHYLGFGRQDRFATAQRLMANQLPPGAVDEIEGGHDWPVWRQLWDRFLDRLLTTRPEVRNSQ